MVFCFLFFWGFLSHCACYIVKGETTAVPQDGATHVAFLWCCMWGRGSRGNNALALLSAEFQSLPLLTTIKLGSSGADSQVGGFVYILGPCETLQQSLCEAGRFSYHCNPHRFFLSEGLRLYFPVLEPWVVQSVLLPSCSSRFICMQIWDHYSALAACLRSSY